MEAQVLIGEMYRRCVDGLRGATKEDPCATTVAAESCNATDVTLYISDIRVTTYFILAVQHAFDCVLKEKACRAHPDGLHKP